jgi:hypothetical protein
LDSSADQRNFGQHSSPGKLCAAPRSRERGTSACAAPRSRKILDSAEVTEKFGQRRKPSKYCTPRSQACKVWASATAGSKSFGRRDRRPKVLDSATADQNSFRHCDLMPAKLRTARRRSEQISDSLRQNVRLPGGNRSVVAPIFPTGSRKSVPKSTPPPRRGASRAHRAPQEVAHLAPGPALGGFRDRVSTCLRDKLFLVFFRSGMLPTDCAIDHKNFSNHPTDLPRKPWTGATFTPGGLPTDFSAVSTGSRRGLDGLWTSSRRIAG